MSIRARADAERTTARRFEAQVAVAFAESQDPEARAEALLGVRPVSEDRFAQLATLSAVPP